MASVQTISEIQLTNNDTVNFYAGDEVLRNVSKVIPNTQTYILRDKENIIILQPAGGTDYKLSNGTSINDPFIFSTLALTKIGGKNYDLINPNDQDSGEQVLSKAIDVYNYLVSTIFVGCCECDGCGKGCQVQYQWGDLATGRFIFTSGLLLMDFTSNSDQDLEDLLTALPDGSWVTFLSTSDPTLFSIFEISDLSVISGYAAWTATLVAGQSTFTGNPSFCVTFQPALGGGGGNQKWQETLDVNPDVDKDNTVSGSNLWSFYWAGFVNWFVNVIDTIRLTASSSGYASIFTMTNVSGQLRVQQTGVSVGSVAVSSTRAGMSASTAGIQANPPFIDVRSDNTVNIGGSSGFNGAQYNNDYEAFFLDRTLVTKQWVLALAAGVQPDAWKQPCEVATTGNITLSGEQTIDGVLTVTSRVLVKDQSDLTENGIYVSDAGAWTRATDMDADAEFLGAVVGVTLGTTNANTYWIQETAPVTLGVSNIVFGSFAIPTTFGGAIIDITVAGLQGLQATSLINPQVYYRVTDSTPVPCIVSGASVGSSSALAFLEGESDGTGIIALGGTGTYDLAMGTFEYSFLFDINTAGLFFGISPLANTLTSTSVFEIHANASGNNVISANYIELHQDSSNNDLSTGAYVCKLEQFVKNFVFSNTLQFCTIKQGLNGNKADNSGPIDFITGVTFLYWRTSPWEIRDIDRVNELLFLYVTYGDGSDPEEGWYDPSTDTFTPVAGGGGVLSVDGPMVDNTDTANPIVNTELVVSSSFTAVLGAYYNATATLTVTDPTPAEGEGFTVFVRNGTATVGGTAYAIAGTIIKRIYHSGAWDNYVYNAPIVITSQLTAIGNGVVFNAGTTRYFSPNTFVSNAYINQLFAAHKAVKGFVMKGFTYEIIQVQGANAFVLTLMRGTLLTNMVDTAATITIAGGSAAGSYSYSSDFTINDGDYITMKAVQPVGSNSGQAGIFWARTETTI